MPPVTPTKTGQTAAQDVEQPGTLYVPGAGKGPRWRAPFSLGVRGDPTPTQKRRALRVWLLIGTIAVLSLADLYMTLAHLRSGGMGEGNPLARIVMSYQSPWLLSVWKCGCIGLGCVIFMLARYRRSAEIACWVCCLILTALTIHWIHYSNEASKLTAQINAFGDAETQANWVSMDR
jgi:hypothetical protein